MNRKRTFTEKLIVNTWSMVVFIGTFMFAIDFPYYIWKTFDFNKSNIGIARILCIIVCIYLYIKNDDIKTYDILTVKGFEKRLVYHYRSANEDEKITVKNTLKLKDFDEEK